MNAYQPNCHRVRVDTLLACTCLSCLKHYYINTESIPCQPKLLIFRCRTLRTFSYSLWQHRSDYGKIKIIKTGYDNKITDKMHLPGGK